MKPAYHLDFGFWIFHTNIYIYMKPAFHSANFDASHLSGSMQTLRLSGDNIISYNNIIEYDNIIQNKLIQVSRHLTLCHWHIWKNYRNWVQSRRILRKVEDWTNPRISLFYNLWCQTSRLNSGRRRKSKGGFQKYLAAGNTEWSMQWFSKNFLRHMTSLN